MKCTHRKNNGSNECNTVISHCVLEKVGHIGFSDVIALPLSSGQAKPRPSALLVSFNYVTY